LGEGVKVGELAVGRGDLTVEDDGESESWRRQAHITAFTIQYSETNLFGSMTKQESLFF
jgi:hypothetical protein